MARMTTSARGLFVLRVAKSLRSFFRSASLLRLQSELCYRRRSLFAISRECEFTPEKKNARKTERDGKGSEGTVAGKNGMTRRREDERTRERETSAEVASG